MRLSALIVLLATWPATGFADIPGMLGSGNFAGTTKPTEIAAQFVALRQMGLGACRLANYEYWDYQRLVPTPDRHDRLVLGAHKAGVTPVTLFEFYDGWPVPVGKPDKWFRIGKAFAERFRPNSPWLISQGIRDWGVTVYAAFNEPDLTKLDKQAYHDSMKALAEGVHSVDPSFHVVPGGFASANASKDYTLNGYGTALADLFNDGHLAGIDLHTYSGFWAPLKPGNRSSQHDFDAIKKACGITRDIWFYTTEYNYQKTTAEGGKEPAKTSEEQAANYLLTSLWDQLGVVGNKGQSVTRLALVWNLFSTQKDDETYGLCETLEPYVPTKRALVLKMVAAITKGMRFVSLDPRKTGMFVLTDGSRKLWVWQNRANWTDKPGKSITLTGVPKQAKRLTVYGWDGPRRTMNLTGKPSVVVDGLGGDETVMFLAE